MIYEIWDRHSGNRLGEFTSPQEAFRMVARMARKASAHTVEGLVLGREHDGETTKIAEGQALVDSALRQETVQGTSPIRKATRRLAYKKGSGGKKKHK